MEYKKVDGLDKKISRIIFGSGGPNFTKGLDQSELLDAAFNNGINTFDTARRYGLSEKSIGQWFRSRNNRDDVVIISKCAHPDELGRKRVNEVDIREDLNKSIELLGTDYIDIYLLHRDDEDVDVSVVVNLFNELIKEGKIKAYGASNWTYERIKQANEYALNNNLIPITFSSPHYSLAYQQIDPWGGGCVSITGDENKDTRLWYENNQMPIIAYSSLGRGLLTGKVKYDDIDHISDYMDEFAIKGYCLEDNYLRLKRCEELAKQKNAMVSQIALAWLFKQPLNTFAIVSMSSEKRIKDNIKALSIELSDDECRYLNLEEV